MNWIRCVVVAALVVGDLMGQASQSPAPAQAQGPASSQELNIQAYIQLLRSDVRKSKSQIIGQVMQFDAGQAAAFWPIYRQFEADLTKIGDRTAGLIKKYSDNYNQMTNPVADELATELLAIEQQRNDLKKRYYQKFKQALDPITATRFLQVENQLERVVDLQIASQLPVIRASGGQAQ